MAAPLEPGLRRTFERRRHAIAQSWFEVIMSSSFSGFDTNAVHQRLDDLTGRAVALVTAESFSKAEARAIGRDLADLRVDVAHTIGPMLEALHRELVVGLPTDAVVALQPRLSVILVEIAIGFHKRHLARMLDQQMTIHQSLIYAVNELERARRAGAARYRAVVTNAAEGIILADAGAGIILEANPAFQRMFGYTPEELIGTPLHEISSQDRASVERDVRRTMRQGSNELAERPAWRKDGTPIVIEATGTVVESGEGPLLCIIVRDVTERARAAAQLDEARRRLEKSREEERARLARELHDDPLQDLGSLRFDLAGIERIVARERPDSELSATLTHIQMQLDVVMELLRGEIAELRPLELGDVGLCAAIECCAAGLRAEHPLCDVSLDVAPSTQALPEPIALCLLRVAQEAMRNALEHGQAKRIVVRVRPRTDIVILRVGDDGRGFAVPPHLTFPAVPGHLGLVSMAERVASEHGRIRVRSRPERGTIVTVWVPIPEGGQP